MVDGNNVRSYPLLVAKHGNIVFGVLCANDLRMLTLLSSLSFVMELLRVTSIWQVSQELAAGKLYVYFLFGFSVCKRSILSG